MMNIRIITLLCLLIAGCTTQTSNTSRQFEQLIDNTTLTADGTEIKLKVRAYYVFTSKDENLFDDKGYYIDENKSIEDIIVPLIRSAVRNYTGTYSLEELSKKTVNDLENGIMLDIKKVIESMSFENVTVRFTGLIITENTI